MGAGSALYFHRRTHLQGDDAMIRTVIRHANDIEGLVIGDFPPDEIDALLGLLSQHEVYLDDADEPTEVPARPTMVFSPSARNPGRLCLEIIVG